MWRIFTARIGMPLVWLSKVSGALGLVYAENQDCVLNISYLNLKPLPQIPFPWPRWLASWSRCWFSLFSWSSSFCMLTSDRKCASKVRPFYLLDEKANFGHDLRVKPCIQSVLVHGDRNFIVLDLDPWVLRAAIIPAEWAKRTFLVPYILTALLVCCMDVHKEFYFYILQLEDTPLYSQYMVEQW